MAKQDALDAINATIVENNQKGITAQSLKNVLVTMVENAGESEEGGSSLEPIKVMIEDPLSEELFLGEFTPAVFELILQELEANIPNIRTTEWAKAVEASFAHNAQVYQTMLNKANNSEGTFALLDYSKCLAEAYKQDVATASMQVSAGEVGMIACITGANNIIPTSVMIYRPSYAAEHGVEVMYELQADGGLVGTINTFELFVPEEGATLTDFQKKSNQNVDYTTRNVTFVTGSGSLSAKTMSVIGYNTNRMYYFDLSNGVTIKQAEVASDGTVTVTTAAVLSVQTA
jgi:hypothetical protein